MARIRIVSGATTYYADEIQASNFTIQLNSFAADTAQFLLPRSIQATALFAAGQPLDIYLGDVRVFTGQIRATPAETMVTGDRHVVNASGGWWWLEQFTFQQLARRYVSGVKTDVQISEVRLGRSASGNAIQKCGTVIQDAIDFAKSSGAAIDAGTITAGPDFPEEDALDVTCAEVVFRVVRWMPDMIAGFDHSTGRLSVVTAPTATVSLDLHAAAYRIERADPAARVDLVVPGVRIDYQITATVNGKNILRLVREEAGDPTKAGAVIHTMAIRGASLTRVQQTQDIKVEALPDDADPAWWKDHCPDLADPRITNLVLANPANTGAFGPNELIEGSVQDWMLAGVPGANYQLAAGETDYTIEATYDIEVDGKSVHVAGRKYTAKVTTTTATSRSYSRFLDTISGGEYYPTGLAASLYAASCKTWWDGQVSVVGPECLTTVRPGMDLNIVNGRTEWASMAARIVGVRLDLDSGRTTIKVGPPRQMTVGDLADQLRRNRRRRTPISTGVRLNPDLDDGSDIPQVKLSSHPPRKGASAGVGLVGEQTYLLSDIRLNPTTDMLEVKRRLGYVVWAESEPDWATVTNWDVIYCDEE